MKTASFDLYLDDSGVRFPDYRPPVERSDGIDCFALGGIIVPAEGLSRLRDEYQKFVDRHAITYPLHSHKIRTGKGDFGWLRANPERAKPFLDDLTRFICGIQGYVMACCIHRPGYNARYAELYGKDRWKLCRSAYVITVERAAKFAAKHGRKLNVYIEQTGKREDQDIRSYHHGLIEAGTHFDPNRSRLYNPLDGNFLSEILFKNPNFIKKDNPAAQIADLVLYPIIKGRHDGAYPPYTALRKAGKLIDCVLDEADRPSMGIKYYCFDNVPQSLESKKASETRSPCPPSQTTPGLNRP